MQIQFLGGADEVGRSAVLVNDRLLLDYGVKTATPPQYPRDVAPEAVVVSHGHLDHAGAVPTLLSGDSRPAVHWTPPTTLATSTTLTIPMLPLMRTLLRMRTNQLQSPKRLMTAFPASVLSLR